MIQVFKGGGEGGGVCLFVCEGEMNDIFEWFETKKRNPYFMNFKQKRICCVKVSNS